MNIQTPLPRTKPNNAILQQFFSIYPELKEDHNQAWLDLLGQSRVFTAEAQTRLCKEEKRFLLLLDGQIRVYQLAPDGREFTLYRNNPGEVNVMNLNCIMNNESFCAQAICETRITALSLSTNDFFHALGISESFRLLVLNSMTSCFKHMIDSFQETVFNRLEIRLTCLLGRLFKTADSDVLNITHQDIAHEMGTTREVISRILKQMEQDGYVQLSRGKIRRVTGQQLPGFNSQGFCQV